VFKFIKNLLVPSEEEAMVSDDQPHKKPKVPDGVRVYVVGDIHGRLDLLTSLHAQIAAELAQLPDDGNRLVIYLGDYIDRGADSFGVVDLLINRPLTGCESVFLKGNHESEMESFLLSPKPNHLWTQHGGMETALSYKVRVKAQISAVDRMLELRDKFIEAIPAEHHRFYSNLRFGYEVGDYFMVHAGVRPGLALALHKPEDMLWIREPFLSCAAPFEKMIVHGHTVTPKPITLPNRIGIDTGAYKSGKLTCLVLEGEQTRFLST
jgi:serine/threonine protein phosphatase 1